MPLALYPFTADMIVSGCTLIWGTLTLCTAWAGNYSHMIAIRLLLGFFEGTSSSILHTVLSHVAHIIAQS